MMLARLEYPLTEPRDADCAAKLAKRTLTNLYNERPTWLANAHAKLDAATAAAYGWEDIADAWNGAEHGALYDFATKSFKQIDASAAGYKKAAEANARAIDDEILSRLLALNLTRAAAEQAATTMIPKTKRALREKNEDELL